MSYIASVAAATSSAEAAYILLSSAMGPQAVAISPHHDLEHRAEQSAHLELQHDDGPGAVSIREGRTLEMKQVTAVSGDWAPMARALGIGSVVAAPLVARERQLGAVCVWSRRPNAFPRACRLSLEVVSLHSALALQSLRTQNELRNGIDSAHTIGQAQGILMERYHLSAESAFQVLRRYSQTGNLKLIEVARQVAQTGVLPQL
jgi:hypothetical protein